MKAKSIKGKSTEEIQSELEKAMTDGFKPTLAICFISKSLDRMAIAALLGKKAIAVFGSTTNGEFIDEETEKGSAAILLLDMNKSYFQIYFEEYPEKNYREVSRYIAQKAKNKFAKPAFLVGTSHSAADDEEILREVEDVAGKEVNAYGGAAGDDYSFTETFVFTNGKDSGNAIVCMALDESKVEIKGIATWGWKAVGTEKTVTKSEANHVFTVDNTPVLDITAKYGGLENVTPENNNLLIEIAANFPLQLQREKGDPIMRPGLVIDWSDHSFYTSGSLPQGSKVRFSVPPDFDIAEEITDRARALKNEKGGDADALIIFSCADRPPVLGPLVSVENEGLADVWNAPMAGFFTYGEYGRAPGGKQEYHSGACCWVALKEK